MLQELKHFQLILKYSNDTIKKLTKKIIYTVPKAYTILVFFFFYLYFTLTLILNLF